VIPTAGIITKIITLKFKTAEFPPCSIYSNAISSDTKYVSFLRCVIPVVLSDNKTKLDDIYTYIPSSLFFLLNTCRIIRKFSAEQWIRNVWSFDSYCFVNELNCCEARKVDDNDKSNNNNY